MFLVRHIGGFVGGIRENSVEMEQWRAQMEAQGFTCVTKRPRTRLTFRSWVSPGADGDQPLLFALPAPKPKRKRRRRA